MLSFPSSSALPQKPTIGIDKHYELQIQQLNEYLRHIIEKLVERQ
ncbi:hypothetical protein SAMN05421780_11512 [Flexibacter flexilis DSM 6793]|uniref:Uncharacterized protein n=1 Tax=Flexibacter flexilis DSM 6793 TaxID=927664 RepID=A0A1I1NSN6_9BACT|nr:hypothetical protein SAMN05421780_11512 [Flexibacter flexilis DSM 6793]